MPPKDTFPQAAHWIWLDGFDDAAAAGQFVLFRKTFHLDTIPDQPVTIRVSADTRYRLFVNGHSVSFGPCKSYLEHWHYETVEDARPFLREGHNVLAARVLRFSSTHPGCMSMIRSALPGFILACTFGGSGMEDIVTDPSWKVRKDESVQLIDENDWDFRLGPQFLGLNENVDGRVAALEWNTPSFDDSEWSTAVIKTARHKMSPLLHPHRLVPRKIPAMTEDFARFNGVTKQTGSVPNSGWARLLTADVPVALPANSTNIVDIQADAHTTAFVDLACTFDGPDSESPTIQLLYSESYETPMVDGQRRHKSNRADHANGELYGPRDTYTPHGRGVNRYSPFWWRTFRYTRLTITTRDHPLTLTALTFRATHYPLQVTTMITTPPTSSTFLTDLWIISLRTLRSCMHETYEDGPYYEQNQFAMDARSQMLFTYVVARDDRLARKGLRELHASRCLDDDGLMSTHFPSAGRALRIPTFSLFWVLMVHDHMVFWGDELLVRQYLGAVDGILQYFEERCDDGLVGQFDDGDSGETWAFVDWVDGWMTPGHGFTGMAVPPAYYSHGAATIHSLLYAYTLLQAAELCVFVGRQDTAAEYRERHRVVVAAVRRRCYDSATGFFLDGPGALDQRSQHVQVFAVLADCVSNETVTASDLITKSLLEPKEHGLAQATIAMGFYVFRAASQAGVYDECWPILIQPWQQMMDQNLTTWAESELPGARSDCHGWGATPLYEIVTEILGVECRSAAFLERVLGEKEGSASQIRVAPRRALVQEISSTVAVGGSVGNGKELETISVGWKFGEDVVLSASRGGQVVQAKVNESVAWETRTL